MALSIQIWLLACTVSVKSQSEIPLDFLDRELDGSRVKPEGLLSMLEMFSLNHDHPGLFSPQSRFGLGVGRPGLYGDRPMYGRNQLQYPFQDKRINEHITERPPAPVTEVDEYDTKPEDPIINTNHFGAPHPQEQDNDDFAYHRIDNGPLKVSLLPPTATEKQNLEPSTYENITRHDSVRTNVTGKPILHTSNDVVFAPEKAYNVSTAAQVPEKVSNETLDDKNQIVFPDKLNEVKEQMKAQLQNSNNATRNMNETSNKEAMNDRNNKQDMNVTKNMEAVFVPVNVMQNRIGDVNTTPNLSGNMLLIPVNTAGQTNNQVMTITNDIFRSNPSVGPQLTPLNSVPERSLYTNILHILTPNGMQQAILMPVDNVNSYQNLKPILSNISPVSAYDNIQSTNGGNQNMGVASDIPQDPVIAMLLTPQSIQNIGRTDLKQTTFDPQKLTPSTYAKTLANVPFNPIPGAIFQQNSQLPSGNGPRSSNILAEQHINTANISPTRIENAQTIPTQNLQQINLNGQPTSQNPQQYYIVTGNLPNNVMNNGNYQQPLILNQQANSNNAVNGNTQKYMLVTVNNNNQQYVPQSGQSNTIYTLVNGNNNQGIPSNGVNTVSLNGQTYAVVNSNALSSQVNTAPVNKNGQTMYAVVTIPNGGNGSNNLYVSTAPANSAFQTQPLSQYSLVSMKEDADPKADSDIHHSQ